ncbi:MAG: hypothetical protein JST85_00955 [Acidobacteria bacterium]|nr:hypothetical protein [Acidobacteriota bacterium]
MNVVIVENVLSIKEAKDPLKLNASQTQQNMSAATPRFQLSKPIPENLPWNMTCDKLVSWLCLPLHIMQPVNLTMITTIIFVPPNSRKSRQQWAHVPRNIFFRRGKFWRETAAQKLATVVHEVQER